MKTRHVASLVEAAHRLTAWLISVVPGNEWTADSLKRPGIYRSTVSWIVYEGLFEDCWNEPWFQEGIQAFGLIALEREARIRLLQSDQGDLFVETPDAEIMELAEFVAGESLAIRHDPDFADLLWDPVSAMSHLLSECDDQS